MRAFWLMVDVGCWLASRFAWYWLPPIWWILRQLSRPCVFLWLILVFGCADHQPVPRWQPAIPDKPPSCGDSCGGEGLEIIQTLPTVWPGQVLY